MKRKIVITLILLFAFLLNASLFDRMFSTSKEYSISQGEVTVYALRAVKKRYLDKSKLKVGDLLVEGLNAVQDQLPETLIKYDSNKNSIKVQIYNKTYTANVPRLKDLYDVAAALKQVYGFIEKNYVPEPPLEMTDVEYIAINGILKKLDPHSYIFTPKEFDEFTSSTEGNFGGLGIVISVNDDGEIVVVSPMAGTPAMEAGIEAGDIIVQIDDESAINMSLNQAVDRMRGKPGTQVTIRIKREGVPDLLKFSIIRAEIKIESVVSAMPREGIGYIKLSGFMENTYPSMLKSLQELKAKGMKTLILDMRNNSGGLLSQAIKISDLFLDRGVIVSTVGEDENEVSNAGSEKTDILDIPIIVMINEGTASAAEIVTAALKKNGRATVLGRKSFGKGSVQNLFRIPGGGGLKLTIAQYLTPGEISIQSVGITPEIEVRPSFVNTNKISLFDKGDNITKEEDLKEHIVSKYVPEKAERPDITVRYFKAYKDPEQIIKERRKEKVGVFKSDEEIDIAIEISDEIIKNGTKPYDAALKIKNSEWDKIVAKLTGFGIPWKNGMSLSEPDINSLKISMLSGERIPGGKQFKLTFKAEIKGQIENLIGIFKTEIPYLRNVEIPFGTFTDSITTSVNIKLPESIPWRKESGVMDLYVGVPEKVIKSERFQIETVPLPKPDIIFSTVVIETKGNIDGIIQPGEEVKLLVNFSNVGRGAVLDGRIMLINTNNLKEIFISSGTLSFKLPAGSSKTAEFSFRINNFETKESISAKLAISLYDYKTKYSAGFSIPVSFKAPHCIFKEKVETLEIDKGATLFSSAELNTVIASAKEKSVFKSRGICGQAYLLEEGIWAASGDVRVVKNEKESSDIEFKYSIKMPGMKINRMPVVLSEGKYDLNFEIDPSESNDVFVFLNDRKYFYKRIEPQDKSGKVSLPLIFEDSVNEISIVVKGYDKEKMRVERKYVFFPEGKKED